MFAETPVKGNTQTQENILPMRDSPQSNRSMVAPNNLVNSASAAQLSVMGDFLSEKLRSHPDILATFHAARDAKKKADLAQAEAKKNYEETKK